MSEKRVHIRHCLLFEFNKGHNATVATKNICDVYGRGAIDVRNSQRWFAKFRSGNLSTADEERAGRPSTTDDDVLKAILEADPRQNTRDIAMKMGINQSTVVRHLNRIGMVSKYDVWVPHNLSPANLLDRVATCVSLCARQKHEPFLHRLVTGDEKWVVYNNQTRKRHWAKSGQVPLTTPKAELHQKKLMLCVWWDMKGIIYYELLQPNQTINAEKYCEQLQKLNSELVKKRPELINRKGVVFHHDNARPHSAMMTQHKLKELNWDVLKHPPYSPDLAPSDFHLFLSLQNYLNGKKFNTTDEVKTALDTFFASKPESFYSNGIKKLTERWETVISNNGNYVIN